MCSEQPLFDRFVYILDRSPFYLFNPEFIARVSIEFLFRIFLPCMYVKCCAVRCVNFSSLYDCKKILKILHIVRTPCTISQICSRYY